MKHAITYNGMKYSLSEGQYLLLVKSTVTTKALEAHTDMARMKGLMLKNLFEFNGRSYKRTYLGTDLLRAYKQKERVKSRQPRESRRGVK